MSFERDGAQPFNIAFVYMSSGCAASTAIEQASNCKFQKFYGYDRRLMLWQSQQWKRLHCLSRPSLVSTVALSARQLLILIPGIERGENSPTFSKSVHSIFD